MSDSEENKKSKRHRSRSRERRRSHRSRSRDKKHRNRHRHRRHHSDSSSRNRTRRRDKGKHFDESAPIPRSDTVRGPSGVEMPHPDVIKALLSKSSGPVGNPGLADQTKPFRKIYIGNLPVGVGLTEKTLYDFFMNAVSEFELQPEPIHSVWLSPEESFCFVEFRSVVDTTRCIELLQGVSLGGRTLRVGRPADYSVPPANLADYVLPIMAKPSSLQPHTLSLLQPTQPSTNHPSTKASDVLLVPTGIGNQMTSQTLPALPSKIVQLRNMVTADDLIDDDEFEDILIDVEDECSKFGKLQKVVIPRPGKAKSGVGSIFVLYRSVDAASDAVKALNGRSFNHKSVIAQFYDEDKFQEFES